VSAQQLRDARHDGNCTGFSVATLVGLRSKTSLGIWLTFRTLRFTKRRSPWSLRNRLLFVYGLFGVLPVILLFVLFALVGWALMSELAIYLASSELDRRLASVHSAVEALRRVPANERRFAAPEIAKDFNRLFPGITFYITAASAEHRYPSDSRLFT
jgi:hypothetical protein